MRQKALFGIVAALAAGAIPSYGAENSQWVAASDRPCAEVCLASGGIAVYGDTWKKNGNPFFICRSALRLG